MFFHSLIGSYGNTMFGGFNMSRLEINQAYLKITSLKNSIIYIYGLERDCVQCLYTNKIAVMNGTFVRTVTTTLQSPIKVLSRHYTALPLNWTENVICDIDMELGEFGVYHLEIGKNNCTLDTLKEPVNIYLPIVTVFFIYVLLYAIIVLVKSSMKKWHIFEESKNEANVNEIDIPVDTKKKRMKSLDTFRGVIITLMVFVNYGAGGYKCLKHVSWYGIHLADLLYPCFLWIMGLCVPLAMKSRIKSGETTLKTLSHILRRTCILFAIGVLVNVPIDLRKLRIMGVLQRIAVCYLIHSTLCIITLKKDDGKRIDVKGISGDIARNAQTWLMMFVILIIHTLVVFLVPFEDCPRGYFGPGGLHDGGKYYKCTGGITGHIDRTVLKQHVLHYTLAQDIYRSLQYDPEGILGTLTVLVHVCFGVQAGITLLTYKSHKGSIIRWLIWGVVTGLLGGILCNFSWSDGIIPLCKAIWTTSFMLVACSFAFFLLTLCYVLVDVKKIWNGKPFIFPGMNSIVIYVGHSLTYNRFPFNWYIKNYETRFTTLLCNVTGATIWILITYYMYKKKFFLKI